MNIEQIVNLLVSGAVALATSSTAGAVLASIITNFKLKRLDPDAVAAKLTANIENTTLKVAAAETVKEVIKPVLEKTNTAIDKVNALADIVIAQSKLITALASVYDKSDQLSEPQRVNIINAAMSLNDRAEKHFNEQITPKKDVQTVKLAVKADEAKENKRTVTV